MKHQIYSCQKTEQNLRKGPLGAFVDELATVFLEKGYPKKYLQPRFAVIGELNRWLIQKKIKLNDLNQSQIDQFIRHRSKQVSVVKCGEIVTLDLLLEVLQSHGYIPTTEPEKESENRIEEIVGLHNQYLVEEPDMFCPLNDNSLGTTLLSVISLSRIVSTNLCLSPKSYR